MINGSAFGNGSAPVTGRTIVSIPNPKNPDWENGKPRNEHESPVGPLRAYLACFSAHGEGGAHATLAGQNQAELRRS
jgi:hypothetical protein